MSFQRERVDSPKNLGIPEGDCPNSCVGNPINTAVGNKLQVETDFVGAPSTHLEFRRYYNSLAFGGTPVGEKWRSTYGQKILSPSGSNMAQVYRADGRVDDFWLQSGVWVADGDVKSKLTPVPSSGTQTGWQLVTADDAIELYDLTGKLTSITTRSGLTTTLTYTSGNLTTVTGPFGHTLTFAYDGNGRIQQMTAPDSGVYAYAYDSKNNLISVTYPGSAVRQYTYTNTSFPNHLTGITDENGAAYASFGYDSNGKAVSSQHAGGADLTSVTYNTDGTITVTNPNSSTSTFSFVNVLGVFKPSALTGTILPELGAKAFTYDTNGYLASKTDFANNVTTYTRDARGLELTRIEADGTALARTITTTWHTQFRLPLTVTEPNRATTFTYDSNGNMLTRTITSTSGGLNRAWTYTYNSAGQVLSVNGPRTDVTDITSYTYNTNGTLATITNPLSHLTQITSYDGAGRPLVVTDPNGVSATLTYDGRGRLTAVSKGGLTTGYTYDAVGQLTKITRPDGAFLAFAYDAAHRLTGVSDNLGNYIVYTLDAAGNRTAENVYDPGNVLKQTQTHGYDTVNRRTTDVGAASQTTTYAYDNNSNLTGVTDALSQATTLSYDALDRLTTVTDPLTGQSSYQHDANDNLTNVTDPRTLATGYGHDGLGNQTSGSSPDAAGMTYVYDDAGNLTQSTDAASRVQTYEYDALNRLTRHTATGVADATYTYDTGTYGKGHLSVLSDMSGTTSWSYDALGRVTQQVQATAGASTLTTSYSYNSLGQLATRTYPSGRIVSYGYDANGQVASLSINGVSYITGITYQPFGGVKGWTWGNGATYARTYDQDGRLASYPLTTSRTRTLTYDNAGRITAYTDTNTTLNQSFGYDANDRLTSWTGAWGITELYSYDANGNRRTFSVTGQTLATLAYPSSSNKFTSQTGGAMPYTPAYDATGNITSMAGIAYAYDGRNWLASTTGSAITTNYWVNDFGQRVRKTWNGSPASHVVFTYEPDGRHLGSYGLTGGVTEETVFLGDTPVGMMVGGVNYYVYADHLDAPRTVTNSSNQSRWEWDDADPFARTLPDQNPSGLGTFNWRRGFPGQFYDAEKSAWHNGFRTYHAAFGRYLQPDPIGLAGGDFSNYGYVQGNPVSRVDMLGLEAELVKRGGGVAILLKINIFGKRADKNLAKDWQDKINAAWNGQTFLFGKCKATVEAQVVVGDFSAPNQILVGEGSGRSVVFLDGLNTGTWYPGKYEGVAHEAGHLMGSLDHYTDQGGPSPGWENNIMGKFGGAVEQKNFNEMWSESKVLKGRENCGCE